MTEHSQFIRRASLVVGNDSDGIDLSNLQFTFAISQAMIEVPQSANIKIYNIAPATAQKIKANEYTRIVLQAGYQNGAYGLIFDGQIIEARLGRDSAVDTYLSLICAEGYESNQATINQTLAAGSTEQDSADAAAATMGRSIKYYDYNPAAKLPRGQVLYGMSRNVLHKAAATAGYSYFYENGGISWVPLQGFKDNKVVVLNADTGMIGWPEQTQDGIRVRCLLNPLLEVGSRIQIDNASILRAQYSTDIHFIAGNLPKIDDDGIYRICVLEHNGDTRGTPWYSDIVCVSIDPANAGLNGLVQKGQF